MKMGRQKLGQHFLASAGICASIVESAQIKKGEYVLEIGPGMGGLTGILYDKCDARLTLIEADASFSGKLRNRYPSATLIVKRAEDVDFDELPEPLVVVSNLPYYASVRIFKHCTEHKHKISRMTLMFQKEVANRISADPNVKSYGSLSVFSCYHWKIEKLMTIGPDAFKPPPKVDSTVLGFTQRSAPPVEADYDNFFEFVRRAFTQKRRTLKNNLKKFYTPESIEEALNSASLNRNIRAEAVSLKQFADILPRLIVETSDKKRD